MPQNPEEPHSLGSLPPRSDRQNLIMEIFADSVLFFYLCTVLKTFSHLQRDDCKKQVQLLYILNFEMLLHKNTEIMIKTGKLQNISKLLFLKDFF